MCSTVYGSTRRESQAATRDVFRHPTPSITHNETPAVPSLCVHLHTTARPGPSIER